MREPLKHHRDFNSTYAHAKKQTAISKATEKASRNNICTTETNTEETYGILIATYFPKKSFSKAYNTVVHRRKLLFLLP